MSAQPRIEREQVRGAVVLTLEDRSLPIVRFAVALRGGALFDPPGAAGAHRVLLELMLRGAAGRSREAWAGALEELGSTLSTFAGHETALLRGNTLARNLGPTLALVGEALTQPTLDPGELAPLLEEVAEDLKNSLDHDDVVAEVFTRRVLYAGHQLARSARGELEQVLALGSAELRALHTARVVPQNLVFVFAGDITASAARSEVERILQGLPDVTPAVASVPSLPDPTQLELCVVDKPERAQVQLRLACSVVDGRHPDAFAVWLGAVAFGGTFTSPFTHEVRDVRGWSYTASSSFPRSRLLRAPLVLASAPSAEDAVECLALELELFAKLARGELTTESIELARSYLLNRYPLEIASSADLIVPVIQNELLGLPTDEVFRVPERLAALTVGDVTSALQRHLSADRVHVLMVATAAKVVDGLAARLPQGRVVVRDYQERFDAR